jgi:septal ring factor EnvC (AmiA/AmiB activator)
MFPVAYHQGGVVVKRLRPKSGVVSAATRKHGKPLQKRTVKSKKSQRQRRRQQQQQELKQQQQQQQAQYKQRQEQRPRLLQKLRRQRDEQQPQQQQQRQKRGATEDQFVRRRFPGSKEDVDGLSSLMGQLQVRRRELQAGAAAQNFVQRHREAVASEKADAAREAARRRAAAAREAEAARRRQEQMEAIEKRHGGPRKGI